jgi:HNH endonuclease
MAMASNPRHDRSFSPEDQDEREAAYRRQAAEEDAKWQRREEDLARRREEAEHRWLVERKVFLAECERLAVEQKWDELLVHTEGAREVEVLLCRAAAFIGQGHPLAAVALLDDCLRSAEDARQEAMVLAVRGEANEQAGRIGPAQRDLARAYAHDPSIPGLGGRLQRITAGRPEGRRPVIPREVRTQVWRRDGGRCVECGGRERLEFDHIIPLAMGGSNTERNLQLLCEACNRSKGSSL